MEEAFSKMDLEKKNCTQTELKEIEVWKWLVSKERGRYARNIFPKSQRAKNLKSFQDMLDDDIESFRNRDSTFSYEKKNSLTKKNTDIKTKYNLKYYLVNYLKYYLVNFIIYCFIGIFYLKMILSHQGVFCLTFIAAYCFFPDGLPKKNSNNPWHKFNPQHFFMIVIISVLGYFLNQWVYEQPDTVQIWVTILLPVVYGIIYYAIRHKRKIREI